MNEVVKDVVNDVVRIESLDMGQIGFLYDSDYDDYMQGIPIIRTNHGHTWLDDGRSYVVDEDHDNSLLVRPMRPGETFTLKMR